MNNTPVRQIVSVNPVIVTISLRLFSSQPPKTRICEWDCYGSATGCEAGLHPAVGGRKERATPLVRAAPEPGA
jgi:hypothetical protein